MDPNRIGDPIWAVLPGFHYWPSVVDIPPDYTFASETGIPQDGIFVYFFGLGTSNWVAKNNTLPYTQANQQLHTSGLEYFRNFDDTAAKMFMYAGKEIHKFDLEKKKNVDRLPSGLARVENIKLLLFNAKSNLDRMIFRVCFFEGLDKISTYERVFRDQPIKEPVVRPCALISAIGLNEDISVIENLIGYPKTLKIGDIFQNNVSYCFSIGDLVWAKMIGYVPWPGLIIKPIEKMIEQKPKNTKTDHYCIRFYGADYSCAWIPENNLVPYDKYRRILCLKGVKDILRKKHSLNSFLSACEQAMKEARETKTIDLQMSLVYKEKAESERKRFVMANTPKIPNLCIGDYTNFYIKLSSEYNAHKSQMEEEDGVQMDMEEIGPSGSQKKNGNSKLKSIYKKKSASPKQHKHLTIKNERHRKLLMHLMSQDYVYGCSYVKCTDNIYEVHSKVLGERPKDAYRCMELLEREKFRRNVRL